MLLLLVLSLLGGAASFLSDYYGRTCATHFCISSPEGDDLMGVRVYEQTGRMMSIQGKYGECWGPIYGKTGRGTPSEFSLWDEERITWILGSYLGNIRSLVLNTEDRHHPFGVVNGQEFVAYPPKREQVLKGICGLYDARGLLAVAFNWGDRKENSTTKNC
ncbi:pancreatic adenocarcinoma up-regulated factor isoform 2-T2 [Thomomys bottae]